ncbi:MAG: class I SAM-dependent methyltransferase [Wolinella sp.]
MKQGDFSELAKHYHHRPAYSEILLENLLRIVNFQGYSREELRVAEVGAGTGKMTMMLANMGLKIDAVEPNENMMNEGMSALKEVQNVKWFRGGGEDIPLNAKTYDWAIMASSFHWTDPARSLPEFARILKDGGYFSAIWNPRHIVQGTIFYEIEEEIKRMIPSLNRVSSGVQNTKNWTEVLESTGDFCDCFFMEIPHFEEMSKERYMGVWRSVNDIRAQAGERWSDIEKMIEEKISSFETIRVPYRIRAWSARKI